MIIEYHRPKTIPEALALLGRSTPLTLPLGGGTVLSRPGGIDCAVVDVQALGLDQIAVVGNQVRVGAAVRLHALSESAQVPYALARAAGMQGNYNLRQMATTAGQLVSADGRSALAAAWLAMDAMLTWEPDSVNFRLGEWLPLRQLKKPGLLITGLSFSSTARLALEFVARSPADLPIVCAAVACWPAGRTRVVLGGWGDSPMLVMDGPNSQGAEIAARDAYSQAEDAWASAEYRQEMAGILTRRCLASLSET
jgi:CO/xanthine dehydrogenase FAD-binding subunit